MTILKITVENEQTNVLRKLLLEVSYVKNIEEEHLTESGNPSGIETSYQRIKQLLDDAKDQNLFKDINDPSQWQRELRKEWG